LRERRTREKILAREIRVKVEINMERDEER
jgi:hypothetical protein